MPPTYYPGQQYEGYKNSDDFRHYPDNEYIKELGDRGYRLRDFERSNIAAIEERLKIGGLTSAESHDYFDYLDKLSLEIREILQEEKEQGIANVQLEKDLRVIGQLLTVILNAMGR